MSYKLINYPSFKASQKLIFGCFVYKVVPKFLVMGYHYAQPMRDSPVGAEVKVVHKRYIKVHKTKLLI